MLGDGRVAWWRGKVIFSFCSKGNLCGTLAFGSRYQDSIFGSGGKVERVVADACAEEEFEIGEVV